MCVLTGCSALGSVTYANSDQYSVGDMEFAEKIENIESDWPSGSVSVVARSGNTVQLTEKAEDGMPEELRIHWWLDGERCDGDDGCVHNCPQNALQLRKEKSNARNAALIAPHACETGLKRSAMK